MSKPPKGGVCPPVEQTTANGWLRATRSQPMQLAITEKQPSRVTRMV